jgi:hypothetical protein
MLNCSASDKIYRQNVSIADASSTKCFLTVLVRKFEDISSVLDIIWKSVAVRKRKCTKHESVGLVKEAVQ